MHVCAYVLKYVMYLYKYVMRAYTCMHARTNYFMSACICVYMTHAYVLHMYGYVYISTYVRTYIYACLHVKIHLYYAVYVYDVAYQHLCS